MLKDFSKRNNLPIILNKHLGKKALIHMVLLLHPVNRWFSCKGTSRIPWIISPDNEDLNIKFLSNPKNDFANQKKNVSLIAFIETSFDMKRQLFNSNIIQWESKTYKH